MTTATRACDACATALHEGLASWHWVCPGCGLEASTLTPGIGRASSSEEIDEDRRDAALHPIRDRNFDRLLRSVIEHLGRSDAGRRLRLLDVGCAHGWFIEKASSHFDVLGIEPDPFVAERTRRRGIPVRPGFFPDAVGADERFDVIVFNDVLEHIPRTREVLEQCRIHLAGDGLVVVNAPDRRGVFYRASKLLHRLGWHGPFERMWQAGLPSPHLYYFDDGSMATATSAAGLRVVATRQLPSVTARGLYSRIRAVRDVPWWQAAVVSAGTLLLIPFLGVLPSDISVWLLAPAGPVGDRS